MMSGSRETRVSREELSQEARALVSSQRRGVLSTLLRTDGSPYGSLVEYADCGDGTILLLLSALTDHRKNLEEDPRASLFVTGEIQSDDALAQSRVTLVGEAEVVERSDVLRELYLARHPQAAQWIDFSDFAFFRFRIERVRYIAGFGKMGWLRGEEFASSAV